MNDRMHQSASRIPAKQSLCPVSAGKLLAAMISVVLVGLLPLRKAMAESIPALPVITSAVAAANPQIASRRAALVGERNVLRDRTQQHNAACRSVVEGSPEDARCASALAALTTDINRHIEASQQFIANFTSSGAGIASAIVPSGDPMVVDARVPRDGAYLTDQVPELKHSLAADRISKGFQAVINHDWPVALAWWQDALSREPNNAALKRSVALAQWMVDIRKSKAAGPATSLGAAIYSVSRDDYTGAIRQFELAKVRNPAIAPQADSMITALRQRQTKEANDAASAAYWSGEIKKGAQRFVDDLFEAGMNRLSIGDEKGAQEAFNDATFFGGFHDVRPSQTAAPISRKAK